MASHGTPREAAHVTMLLERRPRVVVAVDADASDLPVEIARHLLRESTTELVGLLVEDRRPFAHAAAALAREVSFAGRARTLEMPRLESLFRARAAEARRRFEASAARHALAHAFQVLRGDVVAELVREAAGAEALVVGFTAGAAANAAWQWALRHLLEAPVPSLLVARKGWATGRDIVSVFAKDGDARALDAAARLARRTRSPLTVLSAAATEADRRALTEALQAQLAAADVELRGVIPVPDAGRETILRAARGARLLVLAHPREPAGAALAADLAAQTRLSVLLVKAEGAEL